jgi:hypothetical protein
MTSLKVGQRILDGVSGIRVGDSQQMLVDVRNEEGVIIKWQRKGMQAIEAHGGFRW